MPNYVPLFQKLISFIARNIQSRRIDNNTHLLRVGPIFIRFGMRASITLLFPTEFSATSPLSLSPPLSPSFLTTTKLVRLVSIQFISMCTRRRKHRPNYASKLLFFSPHGFMKVRKVVREYASLDSPAGETGTS